MNSKNKLCAMFLASLLVVSIGTAVASSPVVDVGDGQIDTIGSTTTVNITLNETPNGLSGYNLTVSLSKPSIAEIISVSYPSWATLHDNSTLPADSIWMKAADLLEQVESGATNISLGALTFRGDEEGTSDILITVTKMDDDKGYPINPSIDSGHLRVGEAPEPELAYSPASHDFGDKCEGETDSTTLEIWNSGTDTLTYSLSESCGWVEVNPTSGSSTGEHDTITIDIDTTGLSEGFHTCDISISSNGGSGTFTVTVNVVPCPVLSYLPTSHDFGDKCVGETDSTTLEVWNSGTDTLTYSLSESGSWVEVNPTSGSSTGEHDTITVDVDTTGLSEGSHTCDTTINSNDGTGTFTVMVNVVLCPCGDMTVNPTSWSTTILCGNTDSKTVTVSASGGIVEGVTVSKISGPTWLSVSSTDLGDIASGSSKAFMMTAAPPSGTSGDFTYTVRVSNTCGSPSTRDVSGTITVPPKSDWGVRLDVTCGAGTDVAEFGLNEAATDGFDSQFDLPEPPAPPPPYQQAYFYYPENPEAFKRLGTSYIPPHQEGNSWPFRVDYNGEPSDVTITWDADDIADVPAGYSLYFVVNGKPMIDMLTTPTYTFSATTGTYEFEIGAITGDEKPDLNVTAIGLNCGYLFGNETNEICATVMNNGTADAGAFNVSFEIDGYSTRRKVNGLAAGENITVCITYPIPRNAGDSVLITVTADSDAEIDESNETNNAATLVTTVVNNGYKGKAYTGGSDITTWNTFDLKGDLLYSVGDSYYLSSYSNPDWTTYTANWTMSNLPVPGTATIEEVRLYVIYTWDKAGVMPDEVSLTFNGIVQIPDAHYSDEKGWATSYPYGMLAYDVTDAFDTSGNTAVFTNSHPGGGNVSMRGMLLVVVYADGGEPQRKIFVNEEFDILYGGVGECTTPAEATAWAPFGAIDLSQWDDARLITVAPGAAANEGDLIFNWNKWTAVWNDAGSTQIGIDDRKVSLYLQSADNIAGFQSDGNYMEASNAFLILEKKVEPKPEIWVDPTSFDVTLSTNTIHDYTMRIGNDGTATLMYDISDDETTPKAVVHSEVSEEAVVETLVKSDEHTIELFPSRPISYPILWIPHEISYDDGTAESYFAWSYAGGRWAVRFTPPSYPVDLDTARICLWSRDEDYEPFYIEVYDDDGTESSPGTLLGTVMTIATADGWHDVDISGLGITITSGDFYIAYMQLTDFPKCEMLGCDKTDPQGRSWGRHSGSWSTWPQYNWMIRCVVDLLGYCPWLDENPKSGSVPSGNYNEITVTIDTTGLAKGDYNANIIISNNDQDEDPTIVPVDLKVTEEKPDLIITAKWLCWPDNCTICYNVTNIGTGTAPACHNTTLYVDSVEVAHDHVPVDLAPGESYTGCFDGYEWTYTPPSDNITVCADNNETIVELDEDNNCLTNIWMCGDVRKDGYVTAWDVAVLNSYVAGIGELEVERKWAGDVRTDGYITAWDVAVLNSKVAGIGAISCMCTQPDL